MWCRRVEAWNCYAHQRNWQRKETLSGKGRYPQEANMPLTPDTEPVEVTIMVNERSVSRVLHVSYFFSHLVYCPHMVSGTPKSSQSKGSNGSHGWLKILTQSMDQGSSKIRLKNPTRKEKKKNLYMGPSFGYCSCLDLIPVKRLSMIKMSSAMFICDSFHWAHLDACLLVKIGVMQRSHHELD